MNNDKIIKVTTTVVKDDIHKLWWPTGRVIDDMWYNAIRLRYVWPGYLLNSTDLFGSRGHNPTISEDGLTMTWIRWWYNWEYYRMHLEDEELNKYRRICNDYWGQTNIRYRDVSEEIDPKYTANGYRYIGNGYYALKHLNT